MTNTLLDSKDIATVKTAAAVLFWIVELISRSNLNYKLWIPNSSPSPQEIRKNRSKINEENHLKLYDKVNVMLKKKSWEMK